MKKPSVVRLCILAVSLALVQPAPPLAADGKKEAQEAEIYSRLETFATILDLVQKNYVDAVKASDLLIGAVDGMLNTLDPHSSYLSPSDFKELQEDTEGSFSGIGIEVTIRSGMLTVVAPIAGTPAFKQGVKPGDQIVKINGLLTKDMPLNDAVKLLRGKRGEKVTLSLSSDGQNVREITLVRDLIPHQSVIAAELAPGLHCVQITNFQSDTARDFKAALQKAKEKKPIKGLILDLRNNPGGLLEEAVKVADLFIDRGVLVSTKGREKERDMVFEAHPGTDKYAFPLVALVNGGSASASEIVAGALQDHKRALILGTKTFGKGSVQTVVPLPDGAALRLTTARYYTPNGRSIQETGIAPDMPVPLEELERQEDSEQIREKDLPRHLKNAAKKGKAAKPAENGKQAMERRLAADNQLRAALFILQQKTN